MTEQLAESFFHRRHRVLGRALRPFTFWHAWMLDFGQSPYAGHGGPITEEEIVFAVEVLRRKPSVPGGRVELPSLRWWDRGRVRRHFRRKGIAAIHAQLLCYMADYHADPVCWQTHDSKPVKSHWCLYSISALMRHGHVSERKAWATEVGYGKHHVLALAEAGGHEIQLISDAEQEALKEAGY